MELVLEERSSKGIVKDYYGSFSGFSKDYKEPPYAYSVLMDMVESDPMLFNAVSLTSDLVTYKGYDFIGKNERALERARKLFNETLDFDQVVDNVIWQLLVYGDAYLELRWNETHTEIVELHPCESTEMVIQYDNHGDIEYYLQKVSGKSKNEWVIFQPEEIIYFRMYWVGSQVYSKAPFKSISRSYSTKVHANSYLQSIFMNMPPKMIYFLKNASKDQRKLFVEDLLRAKSNPQMDIVAQGEAFESKVNQVTFDSGLISVLEYLRKEVLMVTRVPPHWVGIMDGANRGIGENVVIPYETKIKKIQQKIASQINRELLPKLDLENLEFKWNAISLMDERTVVEIMNFLSSQGFDSDTIVAYARDHGLALRDGAYLISKTSNSQTLENSTAISRMGDNAKSKQMTNNLDNKGVSAEGKEKLEEKKVVA